MASHPQDILSPLLINPLLQLEQYLSCLKVMSQAGRRQGNNVRVLRACDVLETTATFLKAAQKVVEREQKTTEETKRFWDITGPKFASLKNYRHEVNFVVIVAQNKRTFSPTLADGGSS